MSTPPWGVLSENHIYQLVVREGDRPDRSPDGCHLDPGGPSAGAAGLATGV